MWSYCPFYSKKKADGPQSHWSINHRVKMMLMETFQHVEGAQAPLTRSQSGSHSKPAGGQQPLAPNSCLIPEVVRNSSEGGAGPWERQSDAGPQLTKDLPPPTPTAVSLPLVVLPFFNDSCAGNHDPTAAVGIEQTTAISGRKAVIFRPTGSTL